MLQWFKNHPEFLRSESTALSNDSNYKELFQFRDNLFISHGRIIVRINGIHRYPFLIIYTDATPYRLPLVFPLVRELSEQGVKELSTLSLRDAIERIKPVIKYYYHLRHQNSSGELCILEREDLDGSNKFYGITSILQRVRDWCAGHITGNYPPEGEEVNFEAHFNLICKETKLFYSDIFLDQLLIEGDCYAVLYKYIPKGTLFLEDRFIYLGCFVDGVGSSSIIQNTSADLNQYMLHEKIKSSRDLYTEVNVVENLINQKRLLKAQWFHINTEPSPFKSVTDLVTIIGNGSYDLGVNRILDRCSNTFKSLPDYFFIGLRFANRKGNLEFQLFKTYKKEPFPGYVILFEPVAKTKAILDCYDKVEAVESEKLTAESFHQRNNRRADYNILKDVSINILGVGAIGGELADLFNKSGIGTITLIDNQTLKAHNAVRHIAGIDAIGIPKVQAVHSILYDHNPFVKIFPCIADLYDADLNFLIDNSISISSIADDNVEGFINQQLVITNKLAFYVRALRGGKVARIFRVIPGKDACFNCLSLYRKEGKDFIEIPEDPEYPTLKNECSNPIRPASAADLKLISSIASRIVIDHIQHGETEVNHWIWTSEKSLDERLQEPNQLYAHSFKPHLSCTYCNHDNKISVSIPDSCISFMQDLVSKNPLIETGGVLAGYLIEKGNIFITDVSGPGPNAIQSSTKFEKDTPYCQSFLDKLYEERQQKTIYVGEWHSHPSENNHPSGTDIRSLSEIAVQKNYLTNCPAMIIFSNTGKPSCTLHPAGKRYYFTELNIT